MNEKQSTASKDLLFHGLTTCEGCAMELVARRLLDVLGPKTIVATPPSCSAILTGFERETGWKIPSTMSYLAATGSFISGISVALDYLGKKDINVVGFAGDGGTVDIGLQSLSGAIERGHRFIYICYDNEAYMNTGIQRSGSTALGAWTTTTPGGKPTNRKDVPQMVLAQGIPYLATASAGYLEDFVKKVEKAKNTDGPSYIHVHVPCPTGWRFPAGQTIEVARQAVLTGLWALYEAENGKVRITKRIKNFRPVKDYLQLQRRFDRITPEMVEELERFSREGYRKLEKMEECL